MNEQKLVDYKPVTAVRNAIALLRTISKYGEPVSLATLVRETGISASTSYNILRTMTHEQIISFDPNSKSYQMGIGILEFSLPVLGLNQADIIRPELERLADEHKVVICLWRFESNNRIRLVESVAAEGIVRVEMPRGLRLPAFAGAVGRCYAAQAGIGDNELLAEFEKVIWQEPPTFEDYRKDVEDARSQGYAFDRHQLYRGLETVAALVKDSSDTVRFGISAIDIIGVRDTDAWAEIAVNLRDRADWISEVLFGVPKASAWAERKRSRSLG